MNMINRRKGCERYDRVDDQQSVYFFFNDPTTPEIYTGLIVGRVGCVYETGDGPVARMFISVTKGRAPT